MSRPKLERGNIAPRIAAQTILGKNIDTETLHNTKLWVAFYRYASCPMCDMHFDEVVNRAKELQAVGVRFLAVFESEVANIPPHIVDISRRGFDIVADRNKFLYEQYNIEVSWPKVFAFGTAAQAAKARMNGYKPGIVDGNLATIPAHFLIHSGVIYEAHYGKHAGHHIPFDHALEFGRKKIEEPGIEIELD